MRPLVALAALTTVSLAPALLAGALAACGGSAFTAAGSSDSGSPLLLDAARDAATGFCATAGKHTFCDDFDGLPLSTVWNTIDQNNGTASADSALALSPPRSLASVVQPSALTVTNRGRVIRGFGQVSRIVVSFQLYIDEVGDRPLVGGDSLVAIGLGAGYAIGLDANTSTVGYFENQVPDGGVFQTSLASKALLPTAGLLKTWTAVRVDVDFAHARVSVTINGALLVDGTPITPPTGVAVALDLGAQSRNVGSPVGAHYDNVTVDVTP